MQAPSPSLTISVFVLFTVGAQCADKSDEHNQLCGCEEHEWPCQDGDGCIPFNGVCDGAFNCHDYSDELALVCNFCIHTPESVLWLAIGIYPWDLGHEIT